MTAGTAAYRLRAGTAADRAAVAALQLASWRDAYRGLLPDGYLDGALATDLRAAWDRKLVETPDPRALLLVAVADDGTLAGFLYACPDPAFPASAYLDNLHVAPDRRGGGLGERLLRAAAPELSGAGYRGMHLRVFVENAAALRFYRRLGAEIAARSTDELMGHPADVYRLVWPDLSALL